MVGDSQTFHLSHFVQSALNAVPYLNVMKMGDRCDLLQYLNFGATAPYLGVDHDKPCTHQGPCLFGRENPGCSDCSGCNPSKSANGATSFEFFPIEFARDITCAQPPRFNSTQEAFVHYISTQLSAKPLAHLTFIFVRLGVKCLFSILKNTLFFQNAGLHDFLYEIDPYYARNLEQYFLLLVGLRKQFGESRVKLVYGMTTAVREASVPEQFSHETRNDHVRFVNCVARRLCALHDVEYIDLFAMTSTDDTLNVKYCVFCFVSCF